jgi:hypothetical protein
MATKIKTKGAVNGTATDAMSRKKKEPKECSCGCSQLT